MAGKKISQLTSVTPILTDLLPIDRPTTGAGAPVTGKATLAAIQALIGGGGGNQYWLEKSLSLIYTTGSIEVTGSVANGDNAQATGQFSHAEGLGTAAIGDYSHAEGSEIVDPQSLSTVPVTSSGTASHGEGGGTTASGDYSHAEGMLTTASGLYAHSEGQSSTASGDYSHSEGAGTTASGEASHAEGTLTTASAPAAHAEGQNTSASSTYSHAEGSGTSAAADASHAEGNGTLTTGDYSHAEGSSTHSSGAASHAEGYGTTSSGEVSHAEGYQTTASGQASHSEGEGTESFGDYSHAEGLGTISSGSHQHVGGKYNLRDNSFSLFVIGDGIGDADVDRSDIVRVNSGPSPGTGRFEVTGALAATQGISGSLTQLTDGSSYLVAGPNISITSASNGQVTIEAGASGPVYFYSLTNNIVESSGSLYVSESLRALSLSASNGAEITGSAIFAGAGGISVGSDVTFFVSGSTEIISNNKAVFGGTTFISGHIQIPQGGGGNSSLQARNSAGNNFVDLVQLVNGTGFGLGSDVVAVGDYSRSTGVLFPDSGAGGSLIALITGSNQGYFSGSYTFPQGITGSLYYSASNAAHWNGTSPVNVAEALNRIAAFINSNIGPIT